MSSKGTVSVNRVTIKVLEIQEVGGGEQTPAVDVDLGFIEPPIGHVTSVNGERMPIYTGKMTYWDKKKGKCRNIDMVEAVFSSDEGSKDELGNIKLQISLRAGNTFNKTPVTTIPGDDASVPTHCVDIIRSSDSMVTVTFLEPAEGEFVAYPALYFNTVEGIVDPGISVRRRTGD